MKYNRFDNNSFNNSSNNRFRDSIPTPPSFYRKQMNTPQKPQKKNRFIPEIKDNIGIDKQAIQLAKLFYNSQQYFIKKCKYRNQIGFLYKSTFLILSCSFQTKMEAKIEYEIGPKWCQHAK